MCFCLRANVIGKGIFSGTFWKATITSILKRSLFSVYKQVNCLKVLAKHNIINKFASRISVHYCIEIFILNFEVQLILYSYSSMLAEKLSYRCVNSIEIYMSSKRLLHHSSPNRFDIKHRWSLWKEKLMTWSWEVQRRTQIWIDNNIIST